MLYWLAEQLNFPGVLNLFRYLTFRAGAAIVTALFIGLVAGFGRSRVALVTVGVSAAVAALVHYFIGAPWHVASGALAGIAAAYVAAGPEARA